MMTEAPIAFGLTLVVCLSLFFYCWYIRKLRHRLTNRIQVSATPSEAHIERTGIRKEVVDNFPTVTTHELRVDIKDELQCSICLVEYHNSEVLRKLPFCGHVFHIHCVDSWLQKHVTCPVCRIVLTEYEPEPQPQTVHTLQTIYCRGPSTPNSVTVEIAPSTPAWVLMNRPLPLPRSTPPTSSSQSSQTSPNLQTLETLNLSESDKFEIDLQLSENGGSTAGWGAIYLPRSNSSALEGFTFPRSGIVVIESKECVSHASVSERWMTESFSFGDATERGSCFDSVDEDGLASGRRKSWRTRVVTKSWDFGRSSDEEEVGAEEKVRGPLPLTARPEDCSFEFLPVVTGPGGEYSLTDFYR